jgi:hypothetical protein
MRRTIVLNSVGHVGPKYFAAASMQALALE